MATFILVCMHAHVKQICVLNAALWSVVLLNNTFVIFSVSIKLSPLHFVFFVVVLFENEKLHQISRCKRLDISRFT